MCGMYHVVTQCAWHLQQKSRLQVSEAERKRLNIRLRWAVLGAKLHQGLPTYVNTINQTTRTSRPQTCKVPDPLQDVIK